MVARNTYGPLRGRTWHQSVLLVFFGFARTGTNMELDGTPCWEFGKWSSTGPCSTGMLVRVSVECCFYSQPPLENAGRRLNAFAASCKVLCRIPALPRVVCVCVCVEGNKMKSTNSTKPKSDGLQPKSDDLQSKSDGLRPKEGMRSTLGGTCKQLQTNTNTYQLISPQCMK